MMPHRGSRMWERPALTDRPRHGTLGVRMADTDATWQRFEHDGLTKVDLRISDRLQYHYALTPLAELLARRALFLAVRNGGIVPLNALGEIKRDIPQLKRRVAELVAAGVWIESEWGWEMDVGSSRHVRSKPDDRWKLTPELRAAILERDHNECRACGDTERLVIDHVVPVARGGKTTFDNLQALCAFCNGSKGTRSWDDFLGSLR